MTDALQKAYDQELSLTGKEIIQQLLKNADIARSEDVPM
jgi:fumarate hydratase subunit alpha